MILTLVELIDMKDREVAQPIWLSGCPIKDHFRAKSTFSLCTLPRNPCSLIAAISLGNGNTITGNTSPRPKGSLSLEKNQSILKSAQNLKVINGIFLTGYYLSLYSVCTYLLRNYSKGMRSLPGIHSGRP